MRYRIGICDDEVIQLKVESLYLNEIAKRNNIEINHKGFDNPEELIEFLKKYTFDILLLDIDLKNEVSGIELATMLVAKYPKMIIIFVTGHPEFTFEAFNIEATGYVVKPIDMSKFERILLKAFHLVDGIKKTSKEIPFIITEENIKKKINQEDIIYIQRRAAKSFIITKEREYQVYETITSLYDRLKESFLRINQSEIVNVNRIKEIQEGYVYLKTGEAFTIGRTFRNDVMEAYFGQKK
jgi:DNA-binding LytR/AlgR family response regulator